MKKIKFSLKNIAVMALLIISFIACDKDFATVGSDIIGQNNFGTDNQKFEVIAYTNKLEPVQTNNLPLNYLGAFNDLTYGLTTANFVSQLTSSTINPDFGTNVEIDSVVLTVPYFSRRVEVNTVGESIYELDSIYGDGMVNIEIFENNYFLSDIDPNEGFNTPLRYYSNMSTSNNSINPSLLESAPINIFEDGSDEEDNLLENFKPSNLEIVLKGEENEVSERLSPALRVKLDTTFWHNKIIAKQGEPELSNANNFSNYFRGIYFKTTPIDGNGSMALLNFGTPGANITIYYSKDPLTEGAERSKSTYVLNFGGNRVNFLSNQFHLTIPQGNSITGDEKLYLKGGEGSIAVVDLFNSGTFEDGFSPEFNAFKNDFVETDSEGKFIKAKKLINEANLVFYVDQTALAGKEPERIYLYDLKNGTPLFDYFVDLVNPNVPDNSRINHLGALQREGDVPTGKGVKYKIKITEHINSLLLRDSTNVKLGLAVSLNINLENSAPQYKVLTSEDDIVNRVPSSSILSPRGTVLYGNNTTNEQKKLYLEIYYTDPNN